MEYIFIGDYKVHISRKKVKNLNLRLYRDEGRIALSAPPEVAEEVIREFLLSKEAWIKKHMAPVKVCKKEPISPLEGPQKLFGEEYELVLLQGPGRAGLVKEDGKLIFTSKGTSLKAREKLLEDFYRRELMEALRTMLEPWESKICVSVKELRVRKMKTRWGSCNTRYNRIWINLDLVKYERKFLEFVLVHEMVHLLERNHNRKFYSLMDYYLPSWRELDKELQSKYV